MANLYDINRQLMEFEPEIDPETGELTNALEWDELNMAYAEKVENIGCYVKDLNGDIAKFEAEEKQLAKRRQSLERKVDYLKRLLLNNMGGEKYSSPRCAISFRQTEAVEIEDMSLVPETMLRAKMSVEPNKTAIKAALKAGEAVSGCKLTQNTSIQIK